MGLNIYKELFCRNESSFIKRARCRIVDTIHRKGKTVQWVLAQMWADKKEEKILPDGNEWKRWKRHQEPEHFIQYNFLWNLYKVYFQILNEGTKMKEGSFEYKVNLGVGFIVFYTMAWNVYTLDCLNKDNFEFEISKGKKISLRNGDIDNAVGKFDEYVRFLREQKITQDASEK